MSEKARQEAITFFENAIDAHHGLTGDDYSQDHPFVVALDALCAAEPDNKALTVEPCWCADCIHVKREDEWNYICGNRDSMHFDTRVQEQCTCEECVRRMPEKGE